MAKSKYEPHVSPYLEKIEAWARAGARRGGRRIGAYTPVRGGLGPTVHHRAGGVGPGYAEPAVFQQRVGDAPVAARSCPVCGADSEVYNSRPRKDGAIERRRRCQVCGASFATREVFERFLDRRIDYGD